METEDILMCPGPNEIADRVIRAMLRPAACPVYEEFQELYEQTLDMLAQVFQTTNQAIPIPGSGRSGLESAITSVVERGERTLTIANGQFGEMAMRIANGLGGKAEALSPWGAPIDLDAFAEKLASGPYKLVTMVHNETSTGAVYQAGDVARLAHQNGALFLLDAVSSLGGADLPMDTWDVDLAVSCNHKAIGAPIGHAYVAVSDRAWEVMEQRQTPCGTIYGNLLTWKAQPDARPRVANSQATPGGVFGGASLLCLARSPRHDSGRRTAQTFCAACAQCRGVPRWHHGLRAPDDRPSRGGVADGDLRLPARRYRLQRHSCSIFARITAATLPGIGDYRHTAVRVGHMGVTATPQYSACPACL